MPRFCRHNRFIERCPICSKTLPGAAPAGRRSRTQRGAGAKAAGTGGSSLAPKRPAGVGPRARASARRRRMRTGGHEVHVRRELRTEDDGFRSPLAPGLHASADAARLAEEIAFASARLVRMHAAPPDLFGEIRRLAGEGHLEEATWRCFVAVYLSPVQGENPFAGVRLALGRPGGAWAAEGDRDEPDGAGGRDGVPSLEGIPLGPRTSHDPSRGSATLLAYRHWAGHAGGQARAFTGEESWTPQRRFERLFERLALPGLGRTGRCELLVTLARLGLYELQADSLHLATGRGTGADDATTVVAKRVLGVVEPIYLERRAVAFAQELDVPIDALDLAFANWGAGERATVGFKADTVDVHTLERVRDALGL